jgi:ABC-type nitrate/sulfonate/bicarbonate transport system permease component
MNVAESFGLTVQVYALALATGFLGLAIYIVFASIERWALRWHPSQRSGAT